MCDSSYLRLKAAWLLCLLCAQPRLADPHGGPHAALPNHIVRVCQVVLKCDWEKCKSDGLNVAGRHPLGHLRPSQCVAGHGKPSIVYELMMRLHAYVSKNSAMVTGAHFFY